LHLSIFDALGHDLAAGLLASVCLASCRSTRRAGGPLAAVVARADHAIASQFGTAGSSPRCCATWTWPAG
ncbi:MAG: SpoIIE family protein phosphatase, partial [Actinomycetota bacterium]|nr:SpoIIE family protein phosphatase [Actinomycetota bacterium]